MDQSTADAITKIEQQLAERDRRLDAFENALAAMSARLGEVLLVINALRAAMSVKP